MDRPLMDRDCSPHQVRGLWGSLGVSTVLVLGGSGDYFDVADTVLMLDEYRYADVIERGLWVLPLLMGR